MDYAERLSYEEKTVLTALRWGKSNAYTQRDISRITGYSCRHIRRIINTLRRSHCPVISDETGYYLSDDIYDLEATTKILSSQIRTLLDTRDSLNELVANPKYIEQFKIFLNED